jgi:hypothetical protein
MDRVLQSAPASGWRTMATVEVDAAAGALDEVLSDIRFDSRLEPAPPAHPDRLRYRIVADASRGPDRAARSAGMLLSALDAIARSGEFPGFRIVAADERLRIDANAAAKTAFRPETLATGTA